MTVLVAEDDAATRLLPRRVLHGHFGPGATRLVRLFAELDHQGVSTFPGR
jgi:hypothetical protein